MTEPMVVGGVRYYVELIRSCMRDGVDLRSLVGDPPPAFVEAYRIVAMDAYRAVVADPPDTPQGEPEPVTLKLTSGIDVPLDWNTTDPLPWAEEYERARAEWPERVASVAGTKSWFATLIEVGRRNPHPPSEEDRLHFRNLVIELNAAQTRGERLQARVHELEAQLGRSD